MSATSARRKKTPRNQLLQPSTRTDTLPHSTPLETHSIRPQIKDPFMVQIFARHKDMKSTMRYIHLERTIYQTSDKDEWIPRAARTVDEASELISVGFEYVTEIGGAKLFRKHK